MSTLNVPLLPLRTAVSAWSGPAPRPAGARLGNDAAEAHRWLEERCAERPVVLVVDDLQWADRATLDVLMWVMAGLAHRRLVVVGTLRRGEVGPGDPLARWLADVRRLPGVESCRWDRWGWRR